MTCTAAMDHRNQALVLYCVLLVLCHVTVTQAVRLASCTDQGWVEIEETASNVSIVCDQINAADSVFWSVLIPGQVSTTIGTCSPDRSCDNSPNPLTRPSDTTSVLTIANPSRAIGSFGVQCQSAGADGRNTGSDSCQLNIISAASVLMSTCNIDVNQTSDVWMISGSCDVINAFSSRDYYNCQWTQTSSVDGTTSSPVYQNNNHNNISTSDHYNYTCSFNTALPTQLTTLTFSLTVFPGKVTVVAGSYDIHPPSLPPHITGYSGQPLHSGDTISINCTVQGGNPPVSSVTLTCGDQGQGQATRGSMTSLVVTVDPGMNGQTCVCSADWMIDQWYDLTTSIALLVYYPVTSVELTLNAMSGILEVSENQTSDVMFGCRAFGVPPPSLVLTDDQGREVSRLKAGPGNPGNQSLMTHTLTNVRCEDSAVYTCTASNTLGSPRADTATLRVLCNMCVIGDTLVKDDDGTPVMTSDEGQGRLEFQVLTTDTPHTSSFLYLAMDPHGAGSPPGMGLLHVNCEQTTIAYKSDCVIQAVNATEDTIGYYRVTIATTRDTVTFTFKLQIKEVEEETPEDETGTDNLGFGAGLGIGLGILVVIEIVTVLILWKRQWRVPCAGPPRYKYKEETTRGVTADSTLEMSNDRGTPTNDVNPYSELKTSEIGVRNTYDVMQASESGGRTTPQSPASGDAYGGYEIPA